MNLYDTIFKRRQVRSFFLEPLDQQTIADINAFIKQTDQMEGYSAKIKLVNGEEVSGGKSAPHYLVSYCEDTPAAYANVGYVMENVNLYIQSKGLGSGFFNGAREKELEGNRSVTLAFGNTDIPMRDGEQDYKRVPLSEITNEDNEIARAVRVAPSAFNSQPWELEFISNKVIIKDAGKGLMRIMLKKMNKFDIGIATRHVVLALEKAGKKINSVTPKNIAKELAVEVVYE